MRGRGEDGMGTTSQVLSGRRRGAGDVVGDYVYSAGGAGWGCVWEVLNVIPGVMAVMAAKAESVERTTDV